MKKSVQNQILLKSQFEKDMIEAVEAHKNHFGESSTVFMVLCVLSDLRQKGWEI